MFVYGQFCLFGANKSQIKVGDIIPISKVKSKDNEPAPFYPSNEISNKKIFEINSQLHSWNYSCTLSTHNTYLYTFCAYLFVEDSVNNPGYYKCLNYTASPSFHICASRRAVTRRQEIMEQQQIQQLQQQIQFQQQLQMLNCQPTSTCHSNCINTNISSNYQNPLSFSPFSVLSNGIQSNITQIPPIQPITPFQEYKESIEQLMYNISNSPDFYKTILPLLSALQSRKEIPKDDVNNILNYTLLQIPNTQPSDRFEIDTTGMTKEQFILEIDRPYYQLDNKGNKNYHPSPLYLICLKINESMSK